MRSLGSGSRWVGSGATGTFAFSPAAPAQGSPRPPFFGPGIRTISPGTAVTLEPRACYAIFAYGVGAVGDAGRLVTGFLRSINGQAELRQHGGLGRLLFGVTPHDPLTLLAAAASLIGIALLSCFLPAWRAARIDPMIALRSE